ATVKAKTVNGEVQLQALMDGKKIIITESTVRRYLQLKDAEGVDCLPNATIFEQLALMGYEQTQKPRKPKRKNTEVPRPSGSTKHVADEAVNEEMDDSLVRATTIASSLEAEQDSGGGPKCQETMRDTIAQTRSENVSKLSYDPLLARGNTLRSGEDSMKLMELMEICTKLQQRVLDLENTKTTQQKEINSLKRRVKKLEQKKRLRTPKLKRLYKGRIADIDADAGVTLDSTHFVVDIDMFGVHDLDGDEVIIDNVDVVKTAKETRSVVEEVTVVIEKAKLVSATKETVNAAATTVSTASTILVSAATTTTTTTRINQASKKGVIILLAVHWEHSSRVDIKTLRTWGVTDPQHTPTITQPSTSQPKKTQKPRKPKKNTEVPQPSGSTKHVADEAIYKEMDDSLVRAATTASSLEAGAGQVVVLGINTPRSDEGSMKLKELMEFCTKLQQRVLDLENTKTAQAQEIISLKLRVKKLVKKGGSRTHKIKRLYKVGRSARVISSDEASLGYQEDASKQGRELMALIRCKITIDRIWLKKRSMWLKRKLVLLQKENVVKEVVDVAQVSTAATTKTITTKELTLAQALEALKTSKPKVKRIVNSTTTITTISSKDKGKGIMVEEPAKMKKKDQISFDEQEAKRLQAEFDEEERLAREKDEANKRRKYFAAKRAEEKRNRPPTRDQQWSIMYTYLKNMEGWKPKSLKNKSFANIQEFFNKAIKKVNTFVDYRTELVEESSNKAEIELEENSKKTEAEIAQENSSKRAREELMQKSAKKQKVEDNKEIAELLSLIEVVPDEEEVAVNAIPLATKPSSIVD
ncbi:hypothetical protein Tco_0781259, partial [Tanacetum coccineum]